MKKTLIILFNFVHLILQAQGWEDQSLLIGNNLNAVQFIDVNNGWIVGDNGVIYKYENSDWTLIDTEFSAYNFTGLYFTDSLHGWIIGESGVILQYNNDIVSMVGSPSSENLNDIYMVDEDCGWIGGDERTILKLSENTWSVYPTDNFSNDLGNLTNIQFLDSTFGILIGGRTSLGFTILNYEDEEWHEDNIPYNTTSLSGLFIKDRENIFSTENQELSGSSWGKFIKYNSLTGTYKNIGDIGSACFNCEIDFGETMGWAICNRKIFEYENNGFVQYETYITGDYLNSICMVNDSIGWIVGDNGTILKYNSEANNIVKIDKNRIEVYPNPIQDYLFVNSAIPINKIEISNIKGEIIKFVKVPNEFSLRLNFMDLLSGMYFLKINNNSDFIFKIIKE